MATEDGSERPRLPPGDPALDRAANYDYRDETVERPDLVADLSQRIAGEVRFDAYSRQLYATDASAYEQVPIGVVFPRSTSDVAAVTSYCAERAIPVLPRGGGTSLAGQTVNEAVVLDFTRYMDAVCSVDPDRRRATVEPGVVLADLNSTLAPHDLKFAPDPAWGDKSAIGGAIGNNSTGAHSLVYGKTDAYIERCEVVLADGTVTEFGPVSIAELRERAAGETPHSGLEVEIARAVVRFIDDEADAIAAAYPDLKRNVSGYNLDRLIDEARSGDSVNLARLLAGSEGTLAVVTRAEVALEPVPTTKAVALLTYDGLMEALRDVSPILEHDPAAVEVMDDVLLDLARETEEFGPVVELLPAGTEAVLLVEFYADSDAAGRRAVAALLADRCPGVQASVSPPPDATTTRADHRALDALEAHEPDRRATFWKMRKSGLPILLSRTTDEKHIAFIEDTAVPPEHLPDYVDAFEKILADHETFASYYAHAGPGVLHIRPLINTKQVAGVEAMADIADRVTDLVVEFGGSVSGEHGDGRARTVWNRKLYGDHVWGLFRELKTAFDPEWLLNPGQVCGEVSMTDNLRFNPDYRFESAIEPTLQWANDNGFQGMVELCHGCGGCRGGQDTTGGIMCPTYRAANEEILSTRGRANMLRAAMTGDLDALGPEPDDADVEFLHEVLDLCVGCKGCSRDCPSEVDLAKLKAEVTHAHHRRHGASLRDHVFANIGTVASLGSATAPLSNWLQSAPGAGWVGERLLGVAADRDLPTYSRRTFEDWLASHPPAVTPSEADQRVVVLPDVYTNYSDPEIGRAAVRVLEAANVHVRYTACRDTGRPAFSKGFLDLARDRGERLTRTLLPLVREGWEIVVLEPSDAVMLQSDYPDLLPGSATQSVADATYGFAEYLEAHELPVPVGDDPVVYHAHCHQQSTGRSAQAAAALERAGHPVRTVDSTCCGMAGSFGYEAEHYSLSVAIGELLSRQLADLDGEIVAAGTSCRAQLEHDGHAPRHPAEVLAADLG